MGKKFLRLLIFSASFVPITATASSVIVLGSDYFQTTSAFLEEPGSIGGEYSGNPILGIGNADMIVQRQSNCELDLGSESYCSVNIEVVGLSLVNNANPDIIVRESLTSASTGSMLIASDGSGNGGSFSSEFKVFFDISTDNGETWMLDASTKRFLISDSKWMTDKPPGITFALDGLVGDQDANVHTNLAAGTEFDFYLDGPARHYAEDGSIHNVTAVPIPAAVWLFGSSLLGLLGLLKASNRSRNVRSSAK